MEFHTIQSISVSSLNVYYVQTCNVIHQKPLQTLRFPPDLSVCSLPPRAARSQPSVGGVFLFIWKQQTGFSGSVCSQLRWLLAHGFIPAEGTCLLLAAVCGGRIDWGGYLGICSERS